MIHRRAITVILCGCGAAGWGPAVAAPFVLSGTANVRAGYEANPFLQEGGEGKAVGVGGVTVAGNAVREAPRSTTTLLGSADIGQYTSRYGRNTNFLAGVTRAQTFTPNLQGSANLTYTNTLNPQTNFGFNPTVDTSAGTDFLTVGTRSQRIDGQANLDWRVSEADTLRFGATGSHAKYRGLLGSSYDQAGASFGYLRTLDRRTRVGFNLNASTVRSSGLPSSQSYQATIQVVRDISAYWRFEGGIGAVKQRSRRSVGNTSTTLAFNGSLCGTYPRATICITASRQAAPSGIGGLRTDTQARINASYNITERSQVTLAAMVDQSNGGSGTLIPRQRFYDATAAYSRRLTERLSVGATGRYQRRDTDASALFPRRSPTGYSLNANVIYAFGRIS